MLFLKTRSVLGRIALGPFLLAFSSTSLVAQVGGPSRCFPDLPRLELRCLGTEQVEISGIKSTQYNLAIANPSDFPDELFAASPQLPPCGLNANSARTWVKIVDDQDQHRNGYCAFDESSDLEDMNFKVPQGEAPPAMVRVELEDRLCDITYISNWIVVSECHVVPPFDLSIQEVRFEPVAGEQLQIDVSIGMGLGGAIPDGIHAELQVFEDRDDSASLLTAVSVDVAANGAITCAVTCAGECLSIFGDGVCTGCGCDYSNTFTAEVNPATPNDQIVVILRPAPGALPELPGFGDDEEMRPERPSGSECRVDPASGATECFRRGDSSADATFNLVDVIWTLQFMFLGTKSIDCLDAADLNDGGTVELNDPIGMLMYLILGAAAPAALGPDTCGLDPTDDGLDPCVYFGSCVEE